MKNYKLNIPKYSLGFEVIGQWILYFTSIIVVYFLPSIIKYLYFLILLFITFISKKDYWWIAFFIIIFANIGGLFSQTSIAEGVYQRLPLYKFGPIRLPLYDMFLSLLLLKSIRYGKVRTFYNDLLSLIIIYILLLFMFSFVLGMDDNSLEAGLRFLIRASLFYSIPRIISTKDKIIKIHKLLFNGLIMVIISVIYTLITGYEIGNKFLNIYKSVYEFSEYRFLDSPYLIFLSFIFLSYWLISNENIGIKKSILAILMVLSYILIILSATRGWFISFTIMMLIILFMNLNKKGSIKNSIMVVLICFLLLFSLYTNFQNIFNNIFNRLKSIELLAKGDITAGGTLSRINVRGPAMLKKVKENPLIGFGFSKEYYIYADNHVGWIMQLLQMGIIGTLLIIYLFIRIVTHIRKIVKITNNSSYYVFIIGLIGLIIIHSTSTAIFSFTYLGAAGPIYELLVLMLTTIDVLTKEDSYLINKMEKSKI